MVDQIEPTETPSGRHLAVDPHTAHAIAQRAAESWSGVARAAICGAGAVGIAWHMNDGKVAIYALGVLLLVASPSLARAIIAPLLAFLLKR